MVEFTREDVEKITETYAIVKDLKEKVDTCLDDHEDRLRVLEAQRHRWLGRDGIIVGGISMGVALVIAFFSWLLGRFGSP
ncbi:MAG: hypothetical protein QMC96_12485 [Methanomicrobiales archaeon]|nr:hypothetical protein [Methanomicrobiales archaeon]